MSSPWLPQVMIDECDKLGKNCKISYGMYPDMLNAMGNLLNFTWEDSKEVDGNWGLAPVSGPFNRSGIWSGVFGGIVNGDYMFSTAGWKWNLDRYQLVDFIGITTNPLTLVTSPKPAQFDLGLFVLSKRAWNAQKN